MEAKQQKDQMSMQTRGVSHRGWGHKLRGTNCPCLYTEWGKLNHTAEQASILEKYLKQPIPRSFVFNPKPIIKGHTRKQIIMQVKRYNQNKTFFTIFISATDGVAYAF